MNTPTNEQVKHYAATVAKRVMPKYPHDEKALHIYRSTDGTPIYWRVRVKTHADISEIEKRKEIRPFRWDGTQFVDSEPPAPREGKPLYALELLAMYPAAMVIDCEGENKADAINKEAMQCGKESQIVATTSGGASSATTTNWQPLAGRVVVVWPDNDEAGAKYAADVVERLKGIAASVMVMDIAAFNLPHKGDAVDYFKAGGTLDGLMLAIDAAKPVAQKTAPVGFDSSPADDSGNTNAPAWPMPQPLTAKIEPEPYPIDALPDTIRAAVEEVQAFVQSPFEMVVSSALSGISLACQAHFDIERADKLTSPVSLFLMTEGESGERKTSTDNFFMEPIRVYEKAQAEIFAPLIKDFNAATKAWESTSGGIKDKIRALAKDNKHSEVKKMSDQLREVEHEQPEPPRVPRLIYGDTTPEALAFALAKKYPSAGVIVSEAGIVLGGHAMGNDSAMRNMALLNTMWEGGTHHVERKSTESFSVRGGRLTMSLMVQGETLREFVEKSGQLARGIGFFARFLFALPESTQGTRFFKPAPPNWPSLGSFNQRITEILNIPAPIKEDGSLKPQLLTFTPEAYCNWIGFHDVIEGQLSNGGMLFEVRDVAAKIADNAARLAALFHIFEGGTGAVSADAFERASRIAIWHLSESRRFFSELAVPKEMADAARLDKWLIEHCRRERTHCIARRYAQQHGTVRNGDRLNAAISELVSLDRIQLRKVGKQLSIWLNPALLMEGRAS